MSLLPLILSREPVPKHALGAVRSRRPDVAVVYVTQRGEVEVIGPGAPMSRWQQAVSRFRWRYEVDLGDHRRTVELRNTPLWARGGGYAFEATLEVGFRVEDPAAVVQRDVEDGLAVVYGHILDVCLPLAREYEIEDYAGAEDAINARFRRGEMLEEGINLYRCRARLSLDRDAREHVRIKKAADREHAVGSVQHGGNLSRAGWQNELDLIKQGGQLEMRHREREATAGRDVNVRELILMHLERFPDDTRTALALLGDMERARSERADVRELRAEEMQRFLIERNLIQAIDVPGLREQFFGPVTPVLVPAEIPGPSQATPTTAAAVDWDAPLPGPGTVHVAPVTRLDTEPPVVELHPPAQVVPVYVVLDESLAVQDCIAELNAGIDSLYDALSADPMIAAIVRLAVVGYADGTHDSPLLPVGAGAARPQLVANGRARYGAAFDRLLSRIPVDVEKLKAGHSAVRRPQVLFLSGARPADDDSNWDRTHRQLVDREQQQYAPDIVACGIGGADPAIIAHVATRPELAFMAVNSDLVSAVQHYFTFVAGQVVGYATAVLDGHGGPVVSMPSGFRPALVRS